MELTEYQKSLLLRVYNGQNIRSLGMVTFCVISYNFSVEDDKSLQELVEMGFLSRNQWYKISLIKTTEKGDLIAESILEKKFHQFKKDIPTKFRKFPQKTLAYFMRFISQSLILEKSKSGNLYQWIKFPLIDSRIFILWKRFIKILFDFEFCTKSRQYTSTDRGDIGESEYVCSPKVQKFLIEQFKGIDLNEEEDLTLRSFSFFDCISHFYYDSMSIANSKEFIEDKRNIFNLEEDDVENIVNKMAEYNITTTFENLVFSEKKPFEVLDWSRFKIFIVNNYLMPVVNILLELNPEPILLDLREKIPDEIGKKINKDSRHLSNDEINDIFKVLKNFNRDLTQNMKKIEENNQMISIRQKINILIDTPEKLELYFKRVLESDWDESKKESWLNAIQDLMSDYLTLEPLTFVKIIQPLVNILEIYTVGAVSIAFGKSVKNLYNWLKSKKINSKNC